MVPMEMKNLSLEDFKNKIRRWKPDGCDCKLCKDFVSNLGYINLVWLWDTGLTVRIRKFGFILRARKCLPCWHSPAHSRYGETAAGWEICTGLAMMATVPLFHIFRLFSSFPLFKPSYLTFKVIFSLPPLKIESV